MDVRDLSTPALIIEADALERNLATMSAAHPGGALRPHVKAHKCTSLAARQLAAGHASFTCATPREALGMAAAGLGADLLIANETLDPRRLEALAALGDSARITVAVDSDETVAAAARAGIRECVIDVDIGLPRCGCDPAAAGALADVARSSGLTVRGVMGYEGHLMVLDDRARQRSEVESAMERLRAAHTDVGGDVVSAGGTGTYDLHATTGVTEVQAGSYALMDTYYATLGIPFEQAVFVVGTVVSVRPNHAVADVGLKSLGMDHGNPSIPGSTVWFCSDEHITFAPTRESSETADQIGPAVGDQVRVTPAHVDPTMAMHEVAWLVRGDEVVDRWPIDLRGWG